jgi:hypothetical protein
VSYDPIVPVISQSAAKLIELGIRHFQTLCKTRASLVRLLELMLRHGQNRSRLDGAGPRRLIDNRLKPFHRI